MPSTRFEWHEHIKEVFGEYKSARAAVDRLRFAVSKTPDLLIKAPEARKYLVKADENLEGTYIVRLFASFEAALRSYDRAHHKDPDREAKAAVMIDQIGGKRGRTIPTDVRRRAREVLRVRHYWAHETDVNPGQMTIDEACGHLQAFLSELPMTW